MNIDLAYCYLWMMHWLDEYGEMEADHLASECASELDLNESDSVVKGALFELAQEAITYYLPVAKEWNHGEH